MLKSGTYYLRETDAPYGYSPLSYRIKMTVSKTEITLQAESPGTALYSNQLSVNAEYKFEVQNNPGKELPYTGGPGTAPFATGGAILVTGSGLPLVLRRKEAQRTTLKRQTGKTVR